MLRTAVKHQVIYCVTAKKKLTLNNYINYHKDNSQSSSGLSSGYVSSRRDWRCEKRMRRKMIWRGGGGAEIYPYRLFVLTDIFMVWVRRWEKS